MFRTRNNIITADDLNSRNKTTRLPIVFCVDCTKNMPVSFISQHLNSFLNEINNNNDLAACADILIMQFGKKQSVVREFSLVTATEMIKLNKPEDTEADLGTALMYAIREIQKRKLDYGTMKVNFYQPTVILFSSSEFVGDMQKELETISGLKKSGSISIVPFCNSSKNRDVFEQISVSGKVYGAASTGYDRIFSQLKKSMHSLSASSAQAYKSLVDASTDWDSFTLR